MAKILAGGMPGGAVAGRTDIMEHLLFKSDPEWNAKKKVVHPGTYNANPLAATAGTTCLKKCADPAVQQTCDELAKRLRIGCNTVLEDRSVSGCAWGDSSTFHLILGHECTNRTSGDLRFPEGIPAHVLKASGKAGLGSPLALAMAIEGVDLFGGGGLLSVAHTNEDVDDTIEALGRSLTRLQEAELLA